MSWARVSASSIQLLVCLHGSGCVLANEKASQGLDPDADGVDWPEDCANSDASVHPGADELPYDGVDNDCDPETPDDDLDGDGFDREEDCDDDDASAHPGATEQPYTGVDEDCDEGTPDDDLDSDGYVRAEDCDDADGALNPGADDADIDGVDQDCDGLDGPDRDGDGYVDDDAGGDDCDDADGSRYPGAPEVCGDGLINDCEGDAASALHECLFGQGLRILGDTDNDRVGSSVAGPGDVNGDGVDDVLVGALRSSAGCERCGGAYVFFGPITGEVSIADADMELRGVEEGADAGFSVAAAGDVNGDGLGDLLVGAPRASQSEAQAGAAYLVLGSSSENLGAEADHVALIGQSAGDLAGYAVASAGDVNGDGFADLLVGAPLHASSSGAAYLVFGPVTGDTYLSDADLQIIGENWSQSMGSAVASAGDVDGNGLDDLLVGAPSYNRAYLLMDAPSEAGSHSGEVNVSTLNAIRLYTSSGNDHGTGAALAAGDVDGDGYADVLVGAPGYNSSSEERGLAFLVLGPISDQYVHLDEGGADLTLCGITPMENAGQSVAIPGDLDGSGEVDLAIGSAQAQSSTDDRGAVSIVPDVVGLFDGTGPTVCLDEGFVLRTEGDETGAQLGYTLSAVGDITGDGHLDLLVGTNEQTRVGRAWVFAGGGY